MPFHEISADPFETQAAGIYTPKIFRKIREQIRGMVNWEVTSMLWEEEDDCERIRYEISSVGEGAHREVYLSCILEGSLMMDARCRCRMLESELCWVDLNVGVRWETESPALLPLAP
jgi:hypothetical protein